MKHVNNVRQVVSYEQMDNIRLHEDEVWKDNNYKTGKEK